MDSQRNAFRSDRESRRGGPIEPYPSRHTEFSPAVLVGMGLLMLIVLGAGIWLLFRAA